MISVCVLYGNKSVLDLIKYRFVVLDNLMRADKGYPIFKLFLGRTE